MDDAGEQVLAGAALAADQHRGDGLGQLLRLLEKLFGFQIDGHPARQYRVGAGGRLAVPGRC